MKSLALTNRLLRDLKERELANLPADERIELLDAINSGIQRLYALTPDNEKITAVSIALAAPATVTLTVTNGSAEFGNYAATLDDLYCTIRIDGDAIDNQIVSDTALLHPYSGPTGTVQATIYHDAAVLPEPVTSLVGDPRIAETGQFLTQDASREALSLLSGSRPVGQPRRWWVEANARNQNPAAPAVFRVDALPSAAIRLESQASHAPARFVFTDLLPGSTLVVPFRDEVIEAYLLPMIRGELAETSLWRDDAKAARAIAKGDDAEAKYASLAISPLLSTPSNRVCTPRGY
jgi:hypothetical protein